MNSSRMRSDKMLTGIWFLSTFTLLVSSYPGSSNPVISRMVTEFIKACPYVDLCNKETTTIASENYFPDDLNRNEGTSYVPCCSGCRCDRGCEDYECCPDNRNSSMTQQEFEFVKFSLEECLYPQFRVYHPEKYNFARSYRFISRCPPSYKNEVIREKCSQDYSDFDLKDNVGYMLPVTSIATQTSYKNYYCWLCHGDSHGDVVSWKPAILCRFGQGFVGSVTEISSLVESNDKCNLVFLLPDNLPSHILVRSCLKVIDRCNVTGQWLTYDRFLEEACLSYTSVYNSTYKNVHCFYCNGYGPNDVDTRCPESSTNSGLPSFIALLDFNNLDAGENEDDKGYDFNQNCPDNSRYDIQSEKCRELFCPKGLVLKATDCSPLIQSIDNTRGPGIIETDITIVLKLLENANHLKLTPENIMQISFALMTNFETKIRLLPTETELCNFMTVVKLKKDVDEVLLDMFNSTEIDFSKDIDYLAVSAHLTSIKVKNVKSLITDLSVALAKSPTFSYFQIIYRRSDDTIFTNKSNGNAFCSNVTLELNRKLPLNPIVMDILCHSYNDPADGNGIIPVLNFPGQNCESALSIEPLPFSAKLRVSRNSVTSQTEKGIEILLGGKIFFFDSYVESEKENMMYISWSKYMLQIESQKTATDSEEDYNNELVILTIICLAFSLASLLLSLIVYSVLPSLQTVPGLNNMALFISLIIYQSLTLLNSLTEIQIKWVCTMIGIVLHFSLVSSFFWMFVCTFHMAKTFVFLRIKSSSEMASSKFAIYLIAVEFVSFLHVVGVYVYSLSVGDVSPTGYGGKPCYIQDHKAILYFVGVPLAGVVIADISMFIVVVVKISRLPDMSLSRQYERKNIVIFVKLSTVTGITWMFAFIYQLSSVKLFGYLFIILNASQGVFIMVAFVVNRRVFGMLAHKCSCKHDKDQTKTTSATHTR